MPHSLYDATVRYMLSILRSLDHCLDVAQKHSPNTEHLVTARLYEDMKPLSYQIHQATRISDRLTAIMLQSEDLPNYDDNLKTFEDFHARIKTVITKLSAVKAEDINEKGEELSDIVMVKPTDDKAATTELSGAANAFGAGLPNITFHANMAYAIMRKEGIPLGKSDYISSFVSEYY